MVMSGPTCCCTSPKFRRSAGKETSAHVGRVACRIAFPVIVVATVAIIDALTRDAALRWCYFGVIVEQRRFSAGPGTLALSHHVRKILLAPRQHEVHRDFRFHLYRFPIQNVRPVAPLP